MSSSKMTREPVRVFVSYKKHDDPAKQDGAGRAFMEELSDLVGQRAADAEVPLDIWYDKQLNMGQRWDDEIDRALRGADMYITIYSPGFFEPEGYIAQHELPVIIKALPKPRSREESRVLSLSRTSILPSDIPPEYGALADLQAANEGKPLDEEDSDGRVRVLEEFARELVDRASSIYAARIAVKARPFIREYIRDLQRHLHALDIDSGRTSPEDPLKAPVQKLLENISGIPGFPQIFVSSEARATDDDEVSGVRLDLSVKNSNDLMIGHVELKNPFKSADPTERNPKGWIRPHDYRQWERLEQHPNLIYCNGAEFVHLQRGVKRASVALDPEDDLSDASAENLTVLLRSFLKESPTAPRSPRALADRLAPLTRLLRDRVAGHLTSVTTQGESTQGTSPLYGKYLAWQQALMPSATVDDFADAFAQCYTYALLIGRFEDALSLPLDERQLGSALRARGHELLGDVLSVMVGSRTKEVLAGPMGLIEALVANVDADALTKTRSGGKHSDPWLYFYEDFLAAYDPARREEAGVYYTPLPVVGAQVRMVEHLLRIHHSADYTSENVTVLDPALGTGTYLLDIVQHALAQERVDKRPPRSSSLAKRLHGFELMVGSYSVAHLRLTQALTAEGANLGAEGVKVFLTDTLTAPLAQERNPGQLALLSDEGQAISQEQQRSSEVKRKDTPIRVILGNPPYSRGSREDAIGGLVSDDRPNIVVQPHNSGSGDQDPLLEDFKKDTPGEQVKNLYNSYVYFWRWAIWKACEQEQAGPGIVSFITSSSFLRGPGFAGMRQHMREQFDEIWVLDLGGEGRGAHKEENVFAIQTPVAIVTGVQHSGSKKDKKSPAAVYYRRIDGTESEKLAILDTMGKLDKGDPAWATAPREWTENFIPTGEGAFHTWPELLDLFPWQHSGTKAGRTWVIAAEQEALATRCKRLQKETGDPEKRRELFDESPSGRKVTQPLRSTIMPGEFPSCSPHEDTTMPHIARYGHRSFDRQFIIADPRFIDRPGPGWTTDSSQQTYLVTLTSTRLGPGPAVTVSAHVPDLHFFCNRGAKDVMPLYRDHEGSLPNVTTGLLERLSQAFKRQVSSEELAAYVFALTGTSAYYERFEGELTESRVRMPITEDRGLFDQAVNLGRHLLEVATFGERFRAPTRHEPWNIDGSATLTTPTSQAPEDYPERFSYDSETEILRVGNGEFHHVSPEVWEYQVSGMLVVQSWLGYRMKNPSGKSSSPLDKIQPRNWNFDLELLELLHTLEKMIEAEPEAADLLEQITSGPVFTDLPQPEQAERKPPKKSYHSSEAQGAFDL